jgi:hypothetical protein
MKKVFFILLLSLSAKAQILSGNKTALDLAGKPIYVDPKESTLVRKSAELLAHDLEKVSGKASQVVFREPEKDFIWIGEAKGPLALAMKTLPENWEAFRITYHAKKNALLIAGADRRGTAYGVFTLSREIGVSPWYWWADVPVKRQSKLYVNAKVDINDAPKVKYRGIFINDEAPALSSWSKEKFGGFNSKFYARVFELMLRLKSNYLWPAMWGNAFYDDDPENAQLADDYGIVIGSSHHEPMNRAHDEWRRHGKGAWNFVQNPENLKDFWRTGFKRAWNEKITTVGMRGDGDEPMSRETATELLENIVVTQRKIIEEVSGNPAEKSPQLWALYKEVQDYYDKGMRVPEDITLLLCDDNWGNLRKLPALDAPPRKGGYGIYYHFDYVGGPRNYKWINTTQTIRVWEQMNLAYRHGVKDIWIVNVGDIKPMEYPISFWCDLAWNPDQLPLEKVEEYATAWAKEQFGPSHAKEIGEILQLYTKFNHRRKPELLNEKTYALNNYQEFERVHKEYQMLYKRAAALPIAPEAKDAYFQLVLHPVKAMANLYDLYYHVALNHDAYQKKENTTSAYAQAAREAFKNDSLITLEYHSLQGGKWNHMMSQTHIGYTYWQQPPFQVMPKVYELSEGKSPAKPTATPPKLAPVPVIKKYPQFYEKDGYLAIEAAHFSQKKGDIWKVLPRLGKHGNGISTFPVTLPEQTPGGEAPHLSYEIYTYSSGEISLTCSFAPSLNYHFTAEGLQYAISIDDEEPQIISINKEDKDSISGIWNKWVADAEIKKTSKHTVSKPGKHIIKYWMVSNGVVLSQITGDFGGLKPSYLGPPETRK